MIFVDTIIVPEELNAYFQRGEFSHIADCLRDYASITYALQKLTKAGLIGYGKTVFLM